MKAEKIYKIISAFFAVFLMIGSLIELPSNISKETFVIVMMIVTVLSSALETFFNPNIPDKNLKFQLLGAIGFIAGGLLDHFDVFNFSQVATEWLRFILIITWKSIDFILKEYTKK